MKKIVFMLFLMGMSALSVKTYGKPVTNDCKKVITDFIDSYMNTDFKKMDRIMAPNAVLQMPRGEAVTIRDKSDVVEGMKSTGITHQICEPGYELIGESEALVIARVDFDYGYTIEHNYLIIAKNENKEWKITGILKMFSDRTTNELNAKTILNAMSPGDQRGADLK